MVSYDICLCLTSLRIIMSRSIHVVANGMISFIFKVERYSNVYMYHIFFIHLSVNGHLGCVHLSAIVNSAEEKTVVRVSFQLQLVQIHTQK